MNSNWDVSVGNSWVTVGLIKTWKFKAPKKMFENNAPLPTSALFRTLNDNTSG